MSDINADADFADAMEAMRWCGRKLSERDRQYNITRWVTTRWTMRKLEQQLAEAAEASVRQQQIMLDSMDAGTAPVKKKLAAALLTWMEGHSWDDLPAGDRQSIMEIVERLQAGLPVHRGMLDSYPRDLLPRFTWELLTYPTDAP